MIFIILFFFATVVKADLLLDFYLKHTNLSADPCDDFYRHACPVGSKSENSVTKNFERYMQNFSNPIVKTLFSKFDSPVFADFNSFLDLLNHRTALDIMAEQYSNWCESNDNKSIRYFIRAFFVNERRLKMDNCTAEVEYISEKMKKQPYSENKIIIGNLSLIHKKALFDIFDDVSAKNEDVPQVFESMKNSSLELLEKTPWAHLMDVLLEIREAIIRTEIRTFFHENRETARMMKNIDEEYSHCNELLGSPTSESKLVCLILALTNNPTPEFTERFDEAYNRQNEEIVMGPLFYFFGMDNTNYASKLGYMGFVLGHEFSHTLFEGMTYSFYSNFSSASRQCVLEQYTSTCDSFKEINCTVNGGHLEECGADIIGQQLAYEVFRKQMGANLNENFSGYNVTNHQLFFYGFVPYLCDGNLSGRKDYITHAAENVRVNAIAQLPGFQEAFKCDSESRMIKSKTEQCHVYGPSAPSTKYR